MHMAPVKACERPRTRHLILCLILIGSITAPISAMTDQRFERVALIKNGGDTPPFVDLEYVKADDPAQIAAGDAVAYLSGSQERLLRCNAVRIAVLAETATPDPRRASGAGRARENRTLQPYLEEIGAPVEKNKPTSTQRDLHCTMWVRKLGTNVHQVDDLNTTVDLRRGHDEKGIILTLALWNSSDVAFHGSFKIINVLPKELEFRSTVAVEKWMDLQSTLEKQRRRRSADIAAATPASVPGENLFRDAIAFQEHQHGQALIYQAQAVSIAPGAAVVVDYAASVSLW